jgi:hypothetical protein
MRVTEKDKVPANWEAVAPSFLGALGVPPGTSPAGVG